LYEDYITEYVSEHGGKKDSDTAKRYAKSKMQTEFTLLSPSESKVYKDMAKEYKLKLAKTEEEVAIDEPEVRSPPIDRSPRDRSPRDRSPRDRSPKDRSPRDNLLTRLKNIQSGSQNRQTQESESELEIERQSNKVPRSLDVDYDDDEIEDGDLNGFDDEEFDIFDYEDDDESDLILEKFGCI